MLTQQKLPAFRALESSEEFSETRLEAIGFIFHGVSTAIQRQAPSGAVASEPAAFRPVQQAGKSR